MSDTTFGKLKIKDLFVFANDQTTLCKKVDRTKFEFMGQGWAHSAKASDKVIKPDIGEGIERNTMNELSRMNDIMKYGLNEATKSKFEINHNSYTSAVQEAHDYIEKNGYTVSEDEWFNKVSSGPSKPSGGKTNRLTIRLEKDGKEQKKMAHIQVYNRETTTKTFELNMYIS